MLSLPLRVRGPRGKRPIREHVPLLVKKVPSSGGDFEAIHERTSYLISPSGFFNCLGAAFV